MKTQISQEDKKRIEAVIREKYTKFAASPEGLFEYPTGKTGLDALNYDKELIRLLPDSVKESYCGVGNPFSLGPVNESEAVLDIGCGAGVDTLIAAMMAGPAGKAVGIDLTDEMLQRAEANLGQTDLKNVTFKKASGEELPFEDNSFDVVTSNGAINLIPDKTATMKEIMRVLKPEGRLMIADQILTGPMEPDIKVRIDKWAH